MASLMGLDGEGRYGPLDLTPQAQRARTLEALLQQLLGLAGKQPVLVLLARHQTAAGHAAAGAHYWERAGARATARSAFVEAIHHYGNGLKLLMTLSDGPERDQLELPLQMGLGDAVNWTRGFAAAEVEAAYNRGHEISSRMGETSEQFRILWGLWHFFVVRGDFGKAEELSQEVAQRGQRLQDPSLVPHIHRTLGETLFWRGDFAAAQRETLACLAGAELPPPKQIPGVQNPLVMCGGFLALALWHLGYPDQALARVDAALERAKGSAHSGDVGIALLLAAWVRLLRRETVGAVESAEAARQFSVERGFPWRGAIGDVLLGAAMVAEGHDESGLVQIRAGAAGARATGAGLLQPWFLTLLAAAHLQLGDTDAGLAALAEAESRISHSGERWPEAEVYRLKGEILSRTERVEALRCFRTAIEIARRQHARSPELRAATSLARQWVEDGERQKAHDLLAPIYAWFTEGFDTPDLKDAKALLDELR